MLEERLRVALEAAGMGAWSLDLVHERMAWSEGVAPLLGLPQGALDGTVASWFVHVDPADRRAVRAAIAAARGDRDGRLRLEHRIRRPDGSVRWLQVRGRVQREADGSARWMHGTVADITDRRALDEQLHASREELRFVLDAVPDLILRLDADGVIEYVNRALAGFDLDRAIGTSVLEWIAPAARAEAVAAIAQARDRRELVTAELPGIGPHGRSTWYLARARPVERDGRVVAFIVAATDIGDRRRMEEQLLRAARVESIGRLAGGVAHDFNNVLTAIGGHIELAERVVPAEGVRAHLRKAAEAARRGGDLARQLLGVARPAAAPAPAAAPLAEAVRRVCDLLPRLLGSDHTVVVDVDPALPPAAVDPVQLEQVLLNLALNARDAMPRGGRLSITGGRASLEGPDPDYPGAARGEHIRLRVADTGDGIPPEIIDRVFEPFFTTKGDGRGTGLGLAVVDGIVRRHRGRIAIASRAGEGTEFDVWLPVAAGGHAPVADAAAAPAVEPPAATVLLCEDEPMIRELLEEALRARGLHVLSAGDGEEALARAAAHRGAIDLLVADVVMPRRGGVELAAALRAQRPGLPVLYISGYGEDRLPAGEPVLQKPFAIDAMIARITGMLG